MGAELSGVNEAGNSWLKSQYYIGLSRGLGKRYRFMADAPSAYALRHCRGRYLGNVVARGLGSSIHHGSVSRAKLRSVIELIRCFEIEKRSDRKCRGTIEHIAWRCAAKKRLSTCR
jgi:hypothetical protein